MKNNWVRWRDAVGEDNRGNVDGTETPLDMDVDVGGFRSIGVKEPLHGEREWFFVRERVSFLLNVVRKTSPTIAEYINSGRMNRFTAQIQLAERELHEFEGERGCAERASMSEKRIAHFKKPLSDSLRFGERFKLKLTKRGKEPIVFKDKLRNKGKHHKIQILEILEELLIPGKRKDSARMGERMKWTFGINPRCGFDVGERLATSIERAIEEHTTVTEKVTWSTRNYMSDDYVDVDYTTAGGGNLQG